MLKRYVVGRRVGADNRILTCMISIKSIAFVTDASVLLALNSKLYQSYFLRAIFCETLLDLPNCQHTDLSHPVFLMWQTTTTPAMEYKPMSEKHMVDKGEACEDKLERAESESAEAAFQVAGSSFFKRLSAGSKQDFLVFLRDTHEKNQKQIQSQQQDYERKLQCQQEKYEQKLQIRDAEYREKLQCEHEDHKRMLQIQHEENEKKNFDKDNVRASQLVGEPMPALTYTMKRNGGTVSATARTPKTVEEWVDFNQQQRKFAAERKPYFEKLGFISRVNKPASLVQGDTCSIHCQKNLQTMTEEYLFILANQLLKDPESETFLVNSSKERCGINFQCSPDGVTVLWQRDPVSKEAAPVRATNCWGNKPELIFEKGTNVAIRYNQEVATGTPGKMVHLVEQVVGNMCAMKVNTACINTGVHMIGLKLMDDGVARISPAVSCVARGYDSAWHFVDFMLNSPEASSGFTKVPILPLSSTKIKAEPQQKPHSETSDASKGSESGGANKGQSVAKGKENKSSQSRTLGSGGKGASLSRGLSERPGSLNVIESLRTTPHSKRNAKAASSGSCSSADGVKIKYLHILQESEDRVVWRAQRQVTASAEWTDVVIKCYRTEPEFVWRYKNEVACYRQAASMQVLCHFPPPFLLRIQPKTFR